MLSKEELQGVWNDMLKPDCKLSNYEQSEVMAGFNFYDRGEETLKQFHDQFFDCIISVFQGKPTDFANRFYDYMFPISDDHEKLLNRIRMHLV